MGPYQDFIRMFNKIHVCRLFPPSWHQLTIKGAWVGKTAGGAPIFKTSDSAQVDASVGPPAPAPPLITSKGARWEVANGRMFAVHPTTGQEL